MNNITIVYSYYNTSAVIPELVKNWNSWSEEVKQHVSIIVVDDGSSEKFQDIYKIFPCNCNVEIYEILEDIKWNQPGAYNLGITQAKTEWVMIMPVDRLITAETISKMVYQSLDKNVFYFLKDRLNGKEIGSPPGIILLTKEAFINSGMFDEDFCGNYGYDDFFFRYQLNKKYYPALSDWYLDVLPHASHEHKLNRDTKINSELLKNKLKGIIPVSKNNLRFKWKKINYEF